MSGLTGRFLTRDPIGYEDGINMYAFLVGWALVAVDPSGLHGILIGPVVGGQQYPYLSPGQRIPGHPHNPVGPDIRPGSSAGNGIFICTREVQPGTPCKAVIDSCGGQHTYIQFGGVNSDGEPLDGTGGIGFSGPGRTPPGEEHAFQPTRCRRLTAPPSMTNAQAEACIRNHAPTSPFTFPTYVCSTWAEEAVDTCRLTRGETYVW